MNKESQYLKIAKLIASELNRSINEEDQKFLNNWLIESVENRKIYDEIIRDGWYQLNLEANHEYKAEEGWSNINSRIISTSKIIKFVPKIFNYAAAVVIVFGLGYFFRGIMLNTPKETVPVIVNTIVPGTDKAILTLEDGSKVALDKDSSIQTEDARSNGEKIIYDAKKLKTTKIAFNYLTIPRGGQFVIELSDGTQVWLNSETQLKYPVSFIEGETRNVELVYGEAYFDVSSSTNHKGSKFKVLNKSQEIEVLGTEFNIKAYRDESNIYTTLVEGKVIVDNGIVKQNLVPNQQSKLDTETNKITIAKVDVKGEISWKDGEFRFVNKPLIDIMSVISRWYDVDVVFENKELESVVFIGVINKHQSIEEILSIMKSSSINSYEINNKTILLK